MKKLYAIIILILLLMTQAEATTKVGVCGMPSTKTVQVRVYDITDTTEDVAWTSTGVTERANGQGKSCYYYTATLDTGHAYQIDWKDNSTPVKTAGELIPDNFISTVTVATNQDKTGYTVSTVQDKTGYSLAASQTFNMTGNITGNLSGSVGSVTGNVGGSVASVTGSVGSVTNPVTVGTNNDKTGYALTAAYDPAKTAAQASTALSNATWTDTKAGYIDAAISSRSTYAGGAVASVTGNVGGNVVGSVGSVTSPVTVGTNNDKTGYALASTERVKLASSQPDYAPAIAGDAMTLTGAYDAAKTAASQASVNAIPTNPTLQTTWTDTKAGYVDAAISSRLASASYTAPDNAGIAAIKAKTDNLPSDPADDSDIDTQLAALQADLDNTNQYKADVSGLALQSSVDDLEGRLTADRASKLDNLDAAVTSRSTLTAQQVWEYITRTLTAGGGGATAQEVWEYATRELTGKTGFSLTSAYDPAKTCFQAASYVAPDNTNIGNIWTETQTHPTLAEIEATSVLAKDSTVAKQAELLRGLGLMMENHVEDDIVRNASNLKTSSKFYLYNSKANATTHDKITGLLATYTVAVTYDGSGYVTLFKVVKD